MSKLELVATSRILMHPRDRLNTPGVGLVPWGMDRCPGNGLVTFGGFLLLAHAHIACSLFRWHKALRSQRHLMMVNVIAALHRTWVGKQTRRRGEEHDQVLWGWGKGLKH